MNSALESVATRLTLHRCIATKMQRSAWVGRLVSATAGPPSPRAERCSPQLHRAGECSDHNSLVLLLLHDSSLKHCFSEQVPHHFEGSSPVFSALSGATMPGPNSFWVRTCLRYAQYSGDLPWLRRYLPTVRRGLDYLRGSASSTAVFLSQTHLAVSISCRIISLT